MVFLHNKTGKGSLLNQRIGSLSSDAAVVVSVSGHLDVALLSPRQTPTVLHQEEVLSILGSVANSQHTVVQSARGASSLKVDSLMVKLEAEVRGINGNGDGANSGKGLGQSLLITLGNVGESSDGGTNVRLLESAFAIASFIGIRLLSIDTTVSFNVSEGVVHEASHAAVVAVVSGAVDQLLLRKAHQFASLLRMLTFERAGGGESPARATLLLVLDGSHQVLVSPVNRSGNLNVVAL